LSTLLDQIKTEGLISPGIMDIVLKRDEDGSYISYYLEGQTIILTAKAICIYSAILVHAYYFAKCIKEGKVMADFSQERLVPDQIAKFWRGDGSLEIGDSVSILKAMSKYEDDVCVQSNQVDLLNTWNDIFKKWDSPTHEDRLILSSGFLRQSLYDLLGTLTILKNADYDSENDLLSFGNGDKLLIKGSPFIKILYEDDFDEIPRPLIPSSCSITEDATFATVYYFDPYGTKDDYIGSPIFFSHWYEAHEAERAVLKMAGVDFIETNIEYEGSFIFLDNFIKATMNIFEEKNDKVLQGNSEILKINAYQELYDFITDTEKERIVDSKEKLENSLWICAIKMGVFEFAKKVISKYAVDTYLIELNKNKLANSGGLKDEIVAKFYKEMNKYITEKTEKIQKKFPGKKDYTDDNKLIKIEAQTILVLRQAGLYSKNIVADYDKVTSIEDYIQKIHSGEKIFYSRTLEDVFTFLICFHTGIKEFYANQAGPKNTLIENIRNKRHQNPESKIINAAQNKREQIRGMTLGSLYQELRTLFEDINKDGFFISSFGRQLCSMKEINKVGDIVKDRNSIEHVKEEIPDLGEYQKEILLFLEYLRTGVPNKKRASENSIADNMLCIYPQVISFKESIVQRNSINLVGYETIEDAKPDKNNPRKSRYILTDRNITQFKEYYCIPNAQRTTDEWMIQPFLLNCDEFDSRVLSHKKKVKK